MKDKLFYGFITVAILLAASCEKQELDCDCTRYERISYEPTDPKSNLIPQVLFSRPVEVPCRGEVELWTLYRVDREPFYIKHYEFRIECD